MWCVGLMRARTSAFTPWITIPQQVQLMPIILSLKLRSPRIYGASFSIPVIRLLSTVRAWTRNSSFSTVKSLRDRRPFVDVIRCQWNNSSIMRFFCPWLVRVIITVSSESTWLKRHGKLAGNLKTVLFDYSAFTSEWKPINEFLYTIKLPFKCRREVFNWLPPAKSLGKI